MNHLITSSNFLSSEVDIKSTGRKEWVDVARGAMILLVVIYHTNLTLVDYNLSLPVFTLFDKFFRPIRQPVFFFVSGYLLQSLLARRKASHLLKRVSVFVYLYALWSVIQWIIVFQTDIHIERWKFGTELSQLLTMWYRPETGLWFIWTLSIFYVILPPLLKYNCGAVLFALSATSILAMSKLFDSLNFAQLNCLYQAAFFMLGLDGRINLIRYLERRPALIIPISTLAYLTVNSVILEIHNEGLLFGALRFVSCLLGIVLGSSVALSMARMTQWSRGFLFLGRKTLPIFLSHELIIGLIAFKSSLFLAPVIWVKIVVCPAIAVLAISLSLGLEVLAKRIGLRWLYALPSALGSRVTPHTPAS